MNMNERINNLSDEDRREVMAILEDNGATDAAFARVGGWLLALAGYTAVIFWLGGLWKVANG